MSISSADGIHARQQARSLRVGCVQQQPRDRVRHRRGAGGDDFRRDLAAVAILPDGSGDMRANRLAFRIGECSFGGLEDPLDIYIDLFTGVDLHAFGRKAHEQMLAFRRGGGAHLLSKGSGGKNKNEKHGEGLHGDKCTRRRECRLRQK